MAESIFACFTGGERSAKAISRIQNKTYDTDSWNMLIKDAASKNIDDVEPFYEELVKTFPTCGRFWRAYIEHEMRSKRFDKVSKLFQRCLEEVLSIELYKCYLSYVREVKANEPDLLYKAYRFTLDKVGVDPNAIGVYNDYIQFLKDRDVDGSYLDSQRITAVRKAYQEGVINPMFHIDTLWKDYIAFEQSINPIIAEKMVQDRSRDHMNARRVAKEWEVIIRGLNRSWPATPPTFSSEEQRQLDIWAKYIQWEKSNPLRTENNHIIVRRITYAYKQYLLCFGHHPNVWHEYTTYLEEQIKNLSEKETELKHKLLKELMNQFERATKGLMKHNLLMNFAHADFEETRKDIKKANEIYADLIEAAREDKRIDLTLVYIQWMRFTRRAEGLKAARTIFKKAREEKSIEHQIYTAAALMKYHCTKDQAVACKIFELGLKKFSTCSDFILSYIHFMNTLNEENNTRVLFERVLTTSSLQPNETVEIWNSFLEFEAGIGDLSSITKVERRRTLALEKAFPRCTEASWAIDKYKFQDLYPCSLNELKSLGYEPQQAITSLASVRRLMTSLSPQPEATTTHQQSNSASNNGTKNLKSSSNRQVSNKFLNGQTSELFETHDGESEFGLDGSNQSNMCLPDLDQMLPFKPAMNPGFGAHSVPGGTFPPPPAIGMLLSRLPQTGSFWGPYVDIDELCNIVRVSDFDELFNSLVELKRNDSSKPRTKRARQE
uniref:Cleavage stimulation factor subunit 3 n=2 Tax=Aceria tosichella TaxID=561515 RepID=A0A6G1SKG0_9ACAR